MTHSLENNLITIRPYKGERVVLADPINARKVLIRTRILVEWLSASATHSGLSDYGRRLEKAIGPDSLPNRTLGKALENDVRLWFDHGWHPSLEYYLWSRNSNYVDLKDPSGRKRDGVIAGYLKRNHLPERVRPAGRVMRLPAALPLPKQSLGQILMKRRTIRHYVRESASIQLLSSVLWYGLEDVRNVREVPRRLLRDYLVSYGTEFDFYVVAYAVDDLDSGVYYYDITKHGLIQVRRGSFRTNMKNYIFEMQGPKTANWTLVFAADYRQYQWRYRHERALRNLYIEAGRVAQRVIVMGQGFGFGTLPTPAIRDSSMSSLLRLMGARQSPVYSLTMGLDARFFRSSKS